MADLKVNSITFDLDQTGNTYQSGELFYDADIDVMKYVTVNKGTRIIINDQDLYNTSGQLLNTDVHLQNQINALSGNIIASGSILWNRDYELQNQINILSGDLLNSGSGSLNVLDEGALVQIGTSTINFIGSNVTAKLVSGTVNVTVTGGQSNPSLIINEEYELVQSGVSIINFIGENITASLSSSGTVDVTVSSAVDAANITTGILPIVHGGTNSSTVLNNNRIMISFADKIVEDDAITPNRALVSNTFGIPIASQVSTTELNYVSGALSNIQQQINEKLEIAGTKGLFWHDDFSFNTVAGGSVNYLGDKNWAITSTGAGSVATQVASEQGRPGIVGVTGGGAASRYACLSLASNTVVFGDGTTEVDVYVRFPILSTAAVEYVSQIGCGDVFTSASQIDGVYFEYNRLATAGDVWRCVTSSNSTRTQTTTTSPIVANTWYHLRFVVNDAGTSVSFYANDFVTPIATITTNIPTATGRETGMLLIHVTSAGAARTTNIDRVDFFKTTTTLR